MTPNAIAAYAKSFASNLKSGAFYKAPLSEAERQGHHLVASLLEKAADSADVMGHMACDFFNTLVNKETQAAAAEAAKKATKAPKATKPPVAAPVAKAAKK